MNKKILWLLIPMLLLVSIGCGSLPSFSLPSFETEAAPTVAVPTPVVVIPAPVQSVALEIDPQELSAMENVLVGVYDKVNPGVVAIQTLSETGGSQGSGFVYDMQGHIITNYHVVEGASDLEVDFPSGVKVRGEVIGTDLDSDIAVIKVEVDPNALQPVTLGDSEDVHIGQMVIAIGNPFGLSSSMTLGIVSAKGRTLDSMRQTTQGQNFSSGDIIQTDAAINPGNSGGPLINLKGEVIGVNRAIRTTNMTTEGEPINSGIGFAISINIVKRVVPAIIENGKYDYPYLGISALEELSLMQQEALGMRDVIGAYVVEVVSGGPGDQAGLKAGTKATEFMGLYAGGDLIVGVDGRPVRVFGELLSYLMTSKSPGDTITLTVIRDSQKKDIEVTLGERP